MNKQQLKQEQPIAYRTLSHALKMTSLRMPIYSTVYREHQSLNVRNCWHKAFFAGIAIKMDLHVRNVQIAVE